HGKARGQRVEPIGLGEVFPGHVGRSSQSDEAEGAEPRDLARARQGRTSTVPRAKPRFLAASIASMKTDCAPVRTAGTRMNPTERLLASSHRSGTGAPSASRAS